MSIGYTFKEGFAGIRRQKLAAIGSILTITISLLLLGLFYFLAIQTTKALEQIRSQVDVEVFLREPVGKNKLVEIQNQIQAFQGIASTEYVSKEDAAEFFKKEFGEDIKKVLDFNPLPPSFKITLKESFRTAGYVDSLQQQLKAIKGVDDVVYRKDMLEFFDQRTKGLHSIALALGILLALSAVILVSNSIRLAIASRSNVIKIMKLVGASRLFIRAPFIVEGLMIGSIGGMVAAGLLYYFLTFTLTILPLEITTFLAADFKFYGLVMGAGLILGFLGGMLAARRYIGESVV